MDGPAGYFITFTTHGSWLHGDERGSVMRTPSGPQVLSPDPRLHGFKQRKLRADPLTLTQAQREVVVSAIDAACAFRGWELHVLHVRTTHVHMLVSTGVPPAEVLRLVKAWATRRLREAGLVPRLRPVWTAYGSTRYIWSEADMLSVWQYVVHRQGDPLPGGLPVVEPSADS